MSDRLLKTLLILLVCIPMTSTDIFIPALPLMVEELKTDMNTVSFLLSGYMLGFSISLLITGSLSDRYGRKKILIGTFSLYIITCLLIVFCSNIYWLIGLRFLQGLGGGSGTVVGRLILKDYYPENQQVNIMSLLSTGMALAPAIAPQIGAICIYYFNWQSCFLVTFLIGCGILWMLIFKFKETNIKLSQKNPLKQLPFSFFKAFNTKEFIGYTLLIGFAWCAYFVFLGLSSFLFQNEYHYSEQLYAFVIGVVTSGYLIGTTLTCILNKRSISLITIIKLGIVFCFLGGAVLSIAYWFNLSLLLIAAMFIIRLGIGLIMPTSQVGAMRVHTENTGWYMGCLLCVEFMLGGFVLYIAGFLELIQIGLGMVVTILASIGILLLGFNLIKKTTASVKAAEIS